MTAGGPGYIPITISVDGVPVVTRRLVSWGLKITDLSQPFELIGGDLQDDFLDQFVEEGGAFGRGSAWAALRPATVRDRVRRGYGGTHPIEWREGNLLRSVAFRGAPGNVFQVSKDSLSIGTNYYTAAWQHFGTPKMVARPLVGVSWKRRSGIVRRLNEYIIQQAQAQGLDVMGGA